MLWTNIDDIVTGTISVYQSAPLTSRDLSGFSYFPISLSLNILLTLMIVIRLILHTRSIRTTMGISGIGGSYKATVTMLVESSALFAVSSLLVTASLGAESYIVETFYPILSETQVHAFLQLRSPGSLSDVTADWTGHRSPARYSASRQQGRVYEQYCRLRTSQFVQS